MTEEIDVWRAAKLLVDRHGDDAPLEASMRADALLAKGDHEGQRIWMRILKAIEELQRGRRSDDKVN